MVPYIFLVSSPFIFCIGTSLFVKKKKVKVGMLFVFFAFLCVLLSLRGMMVGVDTKNYFYFYEILSSCSFREIFLEFSEEYGFYIFIWIISNIFKNFQIVLTIVAIFFVFIPLFIIYKNETNHPILVVSVFISLCPFAFYFSGISQITGMAFAVPVFYLIKNKKYVWSLLLILFGITFHISTITLLLLFPIMNFSFKKDYFLPMLAIVIAFFLFKNVIFTIISSVISKYATMYSNIENNGSYLMFLAYLFIFVALFIVPAKETKRVFFARGLLFFMTCIQCMSPISHMIMRLNYYLLMFLPIAMSYFFDEKWILSKPIKKVVLLLFCGFFIAYFFFYGIDADNLNINPYSPFWVSQF